MSSDTIRKLTGKTVAVRELAADTSPVSWQVPVTGPTPAQAFMIGVQCVNIPTDGQVAFSVASPQPPIPAVNVPRTPITSPQMMLSVQIDDWPAGAQSTVTVDYWPGATPPPAGSSIQVVMFVIAQP